MPPRPPLDELLALFRSTVAREGTTTDAGDAAGDSIIDTALIGIGDNSFFSMLMVVYPGDFNLVDSMDVTAFDNATGEVTLSHAYKGVAAAIPAGVPYKIVTFRFVPAEVAALTAMVEIRKVPSGTSGIIATTASKYIEIDSDINGAEILAVIINGVVTGFDWTLDVYVPTADAVAAPAAADKRDSIAYLAADTEGGLLKPFAIAYNAFLKFTNDSAGDQTINDVVVVYRSRAAVTIGAWI